MACSKAAELTRRFSRRTVLHILLALAAPWAVALGSESKADRFEPPTVQVALIDVSSAPVVGASVVAFELEHRMGTGRVVATGRSDKQGRLTLAGLRPGRAYAVRAQHPGATVAEAKVWVRPGRTLATIEFPGGISLSGKVVGPDGRPVPGARIRLRWPGHALEDLYAGAEFDFPEAPESVSDETGAFELEPVGGGVWGVSASAPGLLGWRTGSRGGSSPFTIRLQPTCRVVAKDLDPKLVGTGATLRGVCVPWVWTKAVVRDKGTGRGKLWFDGVPQGSFQLTFEGNPYLITPQIKVSGASHPTLEVSVPRTPPPPEVVVQGAVRRQSGEPAANARVGLYVEQAGRLHLAATVTRTDQTGGYRLSMVGRDSATVVRVLAADSSAAGATDRFAPSMRENMRVDVTLRQATRRLSVRATDAVTGQGVPGVAVRLLSLMGPGSGDTSTDPHGRIPDVRGLLPPDLLRRQKASGPGTGGAAPPALPPVRVIVSGNPWYRATEKHVDILTTSDVALTLDRADVVEGRVTDAHGRPAAGLRIRTHGGHADTNSQGEFLLIAASGRAGDHDLRWAAVPEWGRLSDAPRLKRLAPGEYRIPDARRWALELRVSKQLEGYLIRVTEPRSPEYLGSLPVPIDSEGISKPGRFIPGHYRVVLVRQGRSLRSSTITLEPAPEDGVWRRNLPWEIDD